MITEAGENHWHILNRDRTKTYEVFLDGQCFCHHTVSFTIFQQL